PAAAYASLAGWSARWADAGLRPWPSLRDGFLRPSAAGIARGGIPLRTPLARVPALTSFHTPNCAYPAKGHPRPYPLFVSHPNVAIGFGKLRAGTNGPGKTAAI